MPLELFAGEAMKKVSAIHRKLPDGGVLVFMTGQDEIVDMCNRLNKKFAVRKGKASAAGDSSSDSDSGSDTGDDDVDDGAVKLAKVAADAAASAPTETDDSSKAHVKDDEDDSDVDVEDVVRARIEAGEAITVGSKQLKSSSSSSKGSKDVVKVASELTASLEAEPMPVHVVPLYSLLPKHEQMRVFQAPPAGHRLIVVATNVAETSLTIPGIRYVVDCGRAKQREYNLRSGTSTFVIDWISKASAQQVRRRCAVDALLTRC